MYNHTHPSLGSLQDADLLQSYICRPIQYKNKVFLQHDNHFLTQSAQLYFIKTSGGHGGGVGQHIGAGGDSPPAGHHLPDHPGGAQGAPQHRLPPLHTHPQCPHLIPGNNNKTGIESLPSI